MSMTKSSKTSITVPLLLIVTDLDGTLLDHFSYRFDAALPALSKLSAMQIPLIPNTSKTAAELQPLRKQLAINDPYIVENGSALYFPISKFSALPMSSSKAFDCHVVELGIPYQKIIELLTPLKSRFKFTGFNEMTLAELIEATGLPESAAAMAKQRQYSEPILWQDSDNARETFLSEVETAGLRTLQGGRFLHLLGNVDKGIATKHLQSVYNQVYQSKIPIMVLGDSDNDIAMLEAADFPVIVRSPTHGLPELQTDKTIIVSDQCGPEGWNECVLDIVK
jgi:mannosyl-3-phosphoglycerate phosphatase